MGQFESFQTGPAILLSKRQGSYFKIKMNNSKNGLMVYKRYCTFWTCRNSPELENINPIDLVPFVVHCLLLSTLLRFFLAHDLWYIHAYLYLNRIFQSARAVRLMWREIVSRVTVLVTLHHPGYCDPCIYIYIIFKKSQHSVLKRFE